MKKYILPAVLVLLLLVVALVGYISYKNNTKKANILLGRYEALTEEYGIQGDNSKAQMSRLRNIIAQKDEEIRNITAHIVEKEVEISTLHAETDKLESAYATLKDKDAKVYNLETQVTKWKHKFTLAEGIIQDKDDVIFSLNAKYEAQVKISLEWKGLYDREVTLHTLCKQRLDLADKRIGGLRFGGTIKNGLVIGLVGVVVYGLFR